MRTVVVRFKFQLYEFHLYLSYHILFIFFKTLSNCIKKDNVDRLPYIVQKFLISLKHISLIIRPVIFLLCK